MTDAKEALAMMTTMAAMSGAGDVFDGVERHNSAGWHAKKQEEKQDRWHDPERMTKAEAKRARKRAKRLQIKKNLEVK